MTFSHSACGTQGGPLGGPTKHLWEGGREGKGRKVRRKERLSRKSPQQQDNDSQGANKRHSDSFQLGMKSWRFGPNVSKWRGDFGF